MKGPAHNLPEAALQSGVVLKQARLTTGQELTAAAVVERLEAAGAAMLALPMRGYTTQLCQTRYDVVHSALEAYGWQPPALRPAAPSAAEISRMDEAMSWLALIADEKYLLRRIAGARALVHPITRRYLFPWRRLGQVLGADHKSVQRWHGQAIEMIVCGLADTVRKNI